MSGHEARINDALKSLGEEFRLGMVAIDEYRKRRRMLLESWNERDATTSPRSARGTTTTQSPAPELRTAVVPPPPQPRKKGGPGIGVAVVAAAVAIGGAWFAISHRAAPGKPVAPLPAATRASAEVGAIKKAADDFLANNRWDPEPIDAFLAQWTSLSAADRARALEEPSLRTLRHEVEQNLQAETQLVPADAPAEQRRRLDALSRLDRELGN